MIDFDEYMKAQSAEASQVTVDVTASFMPHYAAWLERYEAARAGCARSAHDLIVSTPTPLRGEVAWSFFERPAPLRVRRAVLSTAWESSGWVGLQEFAEWEFGASGVSRLFQACRFHRRLRTPPGIDARGFYVWAGKALKNGDDLNESWLSTSWSTDRRVALRFSRVGPVSVLIRARVRLSDVVYYSDDRGEREVILNKNPRRYSVRVLKKSVDDN